MQIHVFDLDGTLVDTERLVRQAYQQAAQELGFMLPADYWGQPAYSWGCTAALHQRKTEIYSRSAQQVQPAWAAGIFRKLQQAGVQLWVCTGASQQAVACLSTAPAVQDLVAGRVQCGMQVHAKLTFLLQLRAQHPQAELHYYDDNAEHGAYVTSEVENCVLHLKGERVCV